MANSSAVTILDGNSSAKTVSTIDALITAAGTPGANVLTVQTSTNAFSVTVSSFTGGTITSLTSGTVNITGGTITSLTSGTVNLTGGSAFSAAGSPSATVVMSVQASTNGLQIASSQIGTLGQAAMSASVPVTMASNQTTISVAQDTSQLANAASGTFLTPLRSKTTATSSGATTIVSSVASKKIRILAGWVTANGAVNFNFQSHTASSIATGVTYFAAAGDGMVLPFNPVGWFDTGSSESLDVFLSAASSVDGYITYVTV